MSGGKFWDRFQLSRPGVRLIAMLGLVLLGAAACSESGRFTGSRVESVAEKIPVVVVSPVDGAKDVLTSTEISVDDAATVTGLSLKGADGKPVTGGFSDAYAREQGTWVPDSQLAYSTKYTVAVETLTKGKKSKSVSTFTTASKPHKIYSASVNVGDGLVPDGATVGIGLPITVEWSTPIPDEYKDDIERRMFVNAKPAVEGAWHWYSDKQVRFRPKDYWPSGTDVSIRLAYGGFQLGSDGPVGVADHIAGFKVGSAIIATIDNSTHQMTVTQDGTVLRTIPISMGKASSPTPSGTFVVMEKLAHTVFNSESYGVPASAPEGYGDTPVSWALRLTWGGIFHHGAPWSVEHQGFRNVSHGCINIAPEPAEWFFNLSKIGDVTQISGTGAPAEPGDGWGDWNLSWEDWKQGSALS